MPEPDVRGRGRSAATFIMVPGAWHGRWAWERVTPLLETRGHRVLSPELIGMGEDRANAAGTNLTVWANQLADIIQAERAPVILVGHSRGGAIISEVAERIPDRIAYLIYVAAFLLNDGDSISQATNRATRDVPFARMVSQGNGTSRVMPEDIIPTFYQCTPPEWAQRAEELVTPGVEPYASFVQMVHVSPERFGRVPRAYIECLQDRAVPLSLQREMTASLPCDPLITLDCDHSPFYAMPRQLAEILEDVARRA